MAQHEHDIVELLKFGLTFQEDGTYGGALRAHPWRPPYIFEDSPSCPNQATPLGRVGAASVC